MTSAAQPPEDLPIIITPAHGLLGIPLLLSAEIRIRQHLQLQDEIWEEETESFLESLKVGPGQRILEYGSGYGFDLVRLARRVGPQGEVIGVEAAPGLLEESRALLKRSGVKNARVVLGDSALDPVPEGPYDLVFCSWKTGTVQPAPPHPSQLRRLLTRFRTWLATTGRVAFWEYHLEGIRVLPETPTLKELLKQVLAQAGETRASHWLPGELLSTGFLFERAYPRQKAEAPGSTVFRWVEEALRQQAQLLLEKKTLEEAAWQAFQREWEGRSIDPKTLLFSPQLLGIVGRPIDPALGPLLGSR